MNLNCYIIDDEAHAIKVLKRHIENTPGLSLIGSDTNPMEAWDTLVNKKIIPDLLFLDIDMPQISGIELAGLVKNLTTVIFTTAHPDYAVDAYETDALDYLIKPVSYERFLRSITKAKALIGNHPTVLSAREEAFYVKSGVKGKMIKIKFDDIICIEGKGNYLSIEQSQKKHLVYLSLKDMEEDLPRERFIRIHKSFIINLKRITALEGGKVVMDNHTKIDIGPSYKENLLTFINAMLVSKKS